MELVVIPIEEDEYKRLVEICKKYEMNNLEDCINMAIANLLYIYNN